MSSIKSIEPTHLKIITKFDILTELTTYLRNITEEYHNSAQDNKESPSTHASLKVTSFMDFWNAQPNRSQDELDYTMMHVCKLRDYYYNKAISLLLAYQTANHAQQIEYDGIAKIISQYYQFIVSEGIVDQIDRIYAQLLVSIEKLKQDKKFGVFIANKSTNKSQILKREYCGVFDDTAFSQYLTDHTLMHMNFIETISRFLSLYDDNKFQLPQLEYHENDKCSQCGNLMTLFPEESEMRCDRCGCIEPLYGTLFEDVQCYNQQILCVKHKKHNPNNHCIKWLHQLQAKESKVFAPAMIDIINARAVREFTREGVLRSMVDVKCRRVRVWLKETRLAKLNNHAPLVRKIITGLNGPAISPPQLTCEEEQKLLIAFSMAIEIFEVISRRDDVLRLFNKTAIHNKIYYPFFLLKLLLYYLRNDSRLHGLIECIHLQSSSTLYKDDILWSLICAEMINRGKKIKYEPTDRTILIDIF